MGDLIQLRARSCLTCEHARFGGPLTICALTNDAVVDERRAAAECESYEPEEEW